MQHRKKQGGYVLVVVALVITIFLGFVALSVDAGVLYSARASAQRAADAAALAGAFAFVTRPDITSANANDIKQYAISAAAQNKIFGTTVTISTTDVDVDFANRRVTVRVNHPQPTLFARAIGENSANIHAEAIAESANSATSDGCTKPWFIPNTVIARDNLDICDANGIQGACTLGQLLVDPVTRQVTSYAQSWMQEDCSTVLPPPLQPHQPRQFIVKPQNPNQAVSPGTFMAIQLGCSGASCYENNIVGCPSLAVSCSLTYSSEQGDMVGPTRQGVNRLIYYEGLQNCNDQTCTRDSFQAVGQYLRPNGTVGSTSRSLVVAPIIDICTYCPSIPNGSSALSNLPVIGFALIFIEGYGGLNNCGGGGGGGGGGQPGVLARLISIIPCPAGGGGGGGINPQETGPFGQPVRLVRLP